LTRDVFDNAVAFAMDSISTADIKGMDNFRPLFGRFNLKAV
jgi:hypothetical protein